ncbi:uncharacterized protein N7479_005262 [Penicillium vulpinum]|uniref:uncharacterized protein n=1 Tax=Penicillium vulpinum TaxID=29845 RepID=UPI002548008F|nr:uncharacterized protein N7479_005262 [Penicillium vulpinum]KAJ5958112.1 hypothetical protein N7479_005262 [Penicillium vulpinum]
MVRGADYDNGVPQSDNPIENGPNKAHGTGKEVCFRSNSNPMEFTVTISNTIKQPADLSRSHKAAPMPEQTGSSRDVYPGLPTAGSDHPNGGPAKPTGK